MNSNLHGSDLPGVIAKKLRAIRRRAVTLTLLQGLVLTGSVLIAAMLLAMAVDWTVGWFNPAGRYTFTALALAAAAAAFIIWCIRPLARTRTIVATARDVDATLPQLEERWSTVTELSQSQDAPEIRGSEAMIHKVASEAELASAAITPQTVVSAAPAFRASRWLIGATVALAIVFAVNFTQANLLLQRFWMPGKNISLTQVTAKPADGWVPKGEPLTLNADVKGRVGKGPAQLFIRTEKGAEKTYSMSAKTGAAGAFQHSIEDVSDSFAYRVRSGDGQTPWHRITAVERPKISEVKLKVTPPSYSKLPKDEKASLPTSVRVLEGSELEVSFRSDQSLDRMLLDFGNGQSTQLTAGQDNWYHFRSRPTNSFSFAAAAINKFKLENKNKPSCRISVYEDLAPSVKILEPSDDLAVLPGEKVNVTFEATDDFGVAKAEVIVATTKADGQTNLVTIPVELQAEAGKKQLKKTVELDPKALGLKHGDQLSYVVQVTDTRQTPASASAAEAKQPQLASKSSESEAKEQQNEAENTANQDQKQAENDQKDPQSAQNKDENKDGKGSKNDSQSKSSQLAKAGKPSEPKEQKPREGAQPPENEMSKRMLDAGQCAECKPRNISVDEYAGTFEGEKRKKLEIAIDPVLQKLAQLLAQAQEKTDSLKQPAASAEGLQQTHSEPLSVAKTNIKESENAVSDLKSRTANTPYSFIGLQLHNIGEAHITPAGKQLGSIAIPTTTAAPNIEKASFHISRAREMLADLTKTYETVKRDQQIADAMQKLNKMYQVFLEDSQALLGSKKPGINSYDRKIAEVDEEFVKKLKELLEEKKKIMDELAKLLAEDPRMLRRYMAMLQLQGTSYRDQMTLLAERQKQIKEQVAKWNATPEPEREALLPQFRESFAPEKRQIVQDATKLRENLETWLPLDVKADHPQVQAAFARSEKVVQRTAESLQPENTTAAAEALAELRALREELPKLNEISSTNEAKMTAHVANRLEEVESLITAHSGQMKIAESFGKNDFPKVAEIAQSRITQDTVTLGEKLEATERQVAKMSDEIAKKAAQLNKITQGDIIPPQGTTVSHLSVREVKAAEQLLNGVVPAFALAETTFDELMRLIIAKLDEAPPPSAGSGQPPGVEDIMAMLEDEMKAAEGLGIPCRPINVQLMTDWMKPGQNPGQGMGQAQAQAAQAQAQEGKAKAQQLEKQARESAQQALAEAKKQNVGPQTAAKARTEAWNKLASRLQKDLLQGRDNTPPEQYRQAIENYFKIISDSTADAQK
jgi:hypothetical protein